METLAATPTKNNYNRRTNKHLSRNSSQGTAVLAYG